MLINSFGNNSFTCRIVDILRSGVGLGLDTYPIFDEAYRIILNSNIINHYKYKPEIGFETVELFKHELNQKLQEIMPKYNDLYRSALLTIDPFKTFERTSVNTNVTNSDDTENGDVKRSEKLDKTDTTIGSRVDNVKNNNDATRENKDKITGDNTQTLVNDNKTVGSETPTGQLLQGNINDDVYASKISVVDGETVTTDKTVQDNLTNQTEHSESNQDTTSNLNSNIKVINENDIGTITVNTLKKLINESFNGLESGFDGISQSDLLLKYRQTFINIDEMIIKELRCKFMYIYGLRGGSHGI